MTRRALIRVMLSLLLLLSQQMALTHGLSHWAGSLAVHAQAADGADDADDGSLSRSTAQDQTCHQCLAFAQLASVLSNTPRYFAAADPGFFAIASNADLPRCVRTVCGFRSRAPPAAV